MMKKMVNGEEVACSSEEEKATLAEWEENKKIKAANLYKEQRTSAYPPVAEQLDYIYHNGVDAWKDLITSIKEKYPKPNA